MNSEKQIDTNCPLRSDIKAKVSVNPFDNGTNYQSGKYSPKLTIENQISNFVIDQANLLVESKNEYNETNSES